MSIICTLRYFFKPEIVEGLTNASAIGPLSPDNAHLRTSALYSGSPPRKSSRVQRGMPKFTEHSWAEFRIQDFVERKRLDLCAKSCL